MKILTVDIGNSNICIVSFLMVNTSYYKNKSEWKPLSSWERLSNFCI